MPLSPVQAVERSPAPSSPLGRIRRLHSGPVAWMLAGTLLAVGSATFIAWSIVGLSTLPNLAMLFVPAILYCAIRWGLVSALLASVLSVLVYNFLFMEPFGAFGIRNVDDVLAVVIFMGMAVVTSDLANKVRKQAAEARAREEHTAVLYEFSRRIEGATDAGAIAAALTDVIRSRMTATSAVWMREKEEPWHLLASSDAGGRSPGSTMDVSVEMPIPDAAGLRVTASSAARAPTGFEPLVHALAQRTADTLGRLRMKQELEAARRAIETERLASALLNSISHDLRTPLSSIIGATTTLTMPGQAFDDSARAVLLGTIRDEAFRLDRFVRNLLDMSRLEAGALKPNVDWIELGDVIRAAAQRVKPGPKAISIQVLAPGDLPLLRLDPVLTEHALANVIDNAAKHSPPGGVVRISARHSDDRVFLTVEDDGPGIPATELETIFQKFRRVGAGDRGPAGTGLGLSIARGLVEAQGGRLHAGNRQTGGACFTLEFSAKPAGADT